MATQITNGRVVAKEFTLDAARNQRITIGGQPNSAQTDDGFVEIQADNIIYFVEGDEQFNSQNFLDVNNKRLHRPTQPMAATFDNSNYDIWQEPDQRVRGGSEYIDRSGHFNTSTHQFTCPADGLYLCTFNATVAMGTQAASDDTGYHGLFKNGVLSSGYNVRNNPMYETTFDAERVYGGTYIVKATLNDILEFRIWSYSSQINVRYASMNFILLY
jgi:hypothetical protein